MTDFGTEDVGNEIGPFGYTRNLLGTLLGVEDGKTVDLSDAEIEQCLAELDAAEEKQVGPFGYTRNLLGELNLPVGRVKAVYVEIDAAEAVLARRTTRLSARVTLIGRDEARLADYTVASGDKAEITFGVMRDLIGITVEWVE